MIESKKSSSEKIKYIKELEQEKIILRELNLFFEEQSSNFDILNSMSHEFRTPLVIIKSYVDLTLSDKFGKLNKIQRERLEKVQENVELLIKTIFDALSETGRLKNERSL